ncbi:uncharacterized protein JCM15063_006050 [Sporobolomyces koalae]|uniref:uncharacterized protein n=1 Tax=Sporobolomyces koalae TaxID=500713 RepID=UPI00316E27A4
MDPQQSNGSLLDHLTPSGHDRGLPPAIRSAPPPLALYRKPRPAVHLYKPSNPSDTFVMPPTKKRAPRDQYLKMHKDLVTHASEVPLFELLSKHSQLRAAVLRYLQQTFNLDQFNLDHLSLQHNTSNSQLPPRGYLSFHDNQVQAGNPDLSRLSMPPTHPQHKETYIGGGAGQSRSQISPHHPAAFQQSPSYNSYSPYAPVASTSAQQLPPQHQFNYGGEQEGEESRSNGEQMDEVAMQQPPSNGAVAPSAVNSEEKKSKKLPKGTIKKIPQLDAQQRRAIFGNLHSTDEFVDAHYEYVTDGAARHRVLTEYIFNIIHDLAKYATQTNRAIFLAVSDIDERDRTSFHQTDDDFDIVYLSPVLRDSDRPHLFKLGTEFHDLISTRMTEIRRAAAADALEWRRKTQEMEQKLLLMEQAAAAKDAENEAKLAKLAELEAAKDAENEAKLAKIAELEAKIARMSEK